MAIETIRHPKANFYHKVVEQEKAEGSVRPRRVNLTLMGLALGGAAAGILLLAGVGTIVSKRCIKDPLAGNNNGSSGRVIIEPA